MLDYTTIMIARKEHEELARKGTPKYGVRPSQIGLLRRALGGLGNVLIHVGGRLKAQSEPKLGSTQVAT